MNSLCSNPSTEDLRQGVFNLLMPQFPLICKAGWAIRLDSWGCGEGANDLVLFAKLSEEPLAHRKNYRCFCSRDSTCVSPLPMPLFQYLTLLFSNLFWPFLPPFLKLSLGTGARTWDQARQSIKASPGHRQTCQPELAPRSEVTCQAQ
jgi:hypothetical protein